MAVTKKAIGKLKEGRVPEGNGTSRKGRLDKEEMACNKPRRTPGEKKSWVVKGCDNGEEVLVRFGDPDMPDRSYDPERRKNFRARHNCEEAKDKTTAKYWSCSKW